MEDWLKQKIEKEGDHVRFTYRGYDCAIETICPMQHLCGYVRIPETSVLYGRNCDDDLLYSLPVHGGITYAGNRFDDNGWWIGFDCAHAYDLLPGMPDSPINRGEYRDMEYVKQQIKSLVDWIIKKKEKDVVI